MIDPYIQNYEYVREDVRVWYASRWEGIWPQSQHWAQGYHSLVGTLAMCPFPASRDKAFKNRDNYEQMIRLFHPTLLVLGPTYWGDRDISHDFLGELRAGGCKIVARHGENRPEPKFGQLAPHIDILYTCSPAFIPIYEEQSGCNNIKLLFAATDPALFYPVDVEKQIDLMFVGHRGGTLKSRNEVVYKLSEEFKDFWVAGNWWDKARLNHWHGGIYTHNFSQWSSRARIGLCLIYDEHISEMYHPSRLVNTMATGTFALTTYTPGLEKVFTRGEHLDWYSTYDELVEKIHYYLEHEEERERIARQGYEHVLATATMKHRARQVLKDVGLLREVG